MIAIILAGGYAQRLSPLTENKAKPLLPVAGKPIIEHIIDKLTELKEVEKIIISTNLKFKPHFEEWLKTTGYRNIEIIADNSQCEEEKPGAVKALTSITSKLNEDCLVIAGDNLFTSDLKNLIHIFKEEKYPIIALYDVKNLNLAKKYAIVELDPQGRIMNFIEKPSNPKTTLIATCIYLLPSRTLPKLEEYLQKKIGNDEPGRLIEWLHKQQPIHGYPLQGYWYDIGSAEQYRKVRRIFSKQPHCSIRPEIPNIITS